MAVTDELPRLTAGDCESETEHDVVQAPLQLLQQNFAGHALGAGGLLEIIAELAFLGKINALSLLLLAQLQAIADDLRFAVAAMLARRKIALFNRTFFGKTLCALEEQFHALAAAKTTYCIFIACQLFVSLTFSVAERFTGG